MRIIIAWINKYILHIHSPSASFFGYDFEYDWLKDMKNKKIQALEHEVIELNMRIAELEMELAESRAKEGKGALEKMIDGIADEEDDTSGDLISRSALKKEFDKECQCDCSVCEHSSFDYFKGYYHCGLIDNAPTKEEKSDAL